jgi:hypothetical protein
LARTVKFGFRLNRLCFEYDDPTCLKS